MTASILLMYRKGISKDQLVERLIFVYEEIKARNGHVQLTIKPTAKVVDLSLKYLQDYVDIKNNNIVKAINDDNSIMMLQYYRN